MAEQTKFLRLFDLQRRFLQGAHLTVQKMMDDYGVNRRTVNRDLIDMKSLGLKIEEENGFDGRKIWSLATRQKQFEVTYTTADITALFLGRRLFDFCKGTLLEDSINKIYTGIENRLKGSKEFKNAQKIYQKVHFVSDGPKQLSSKSVESLDDCIDGLLGENKVALTYVSSSGNKHKLTIHPYTLVAFRRGLYILAYVEEWDDIFNLAIERIKKSVWLKKEKFDYPKDFNPEKFFENALYLAEGKPEQVVLLFSASTEPFIKIRRFHHSQNKRLTKLKDGRIQMKLKVPINFEIENFVMSFGDNVEVISPPALRKSIKTKLKRALSKY